MENITTESISDIYSNIEDAKAYKLFEPDSKRGFKYNPYSNLCGARPYTAKDVVTTAKVFNSEIEKIHKDNESKMDYYKNIKRYIYFIIRISR